MEFDEVKIKFIDYLIDSGKITEEEADEKNLLYNDVSLFSYLSELQQFLYSENYTDSDVFTKNYTEITEMDFGDTTLGEEENDETDTSVNTAEDNETKQIAEPITGTEVDFEYSDAITNPFIDEDKIDDNAIVTPEENEYTDYREFLDEMYEDEDVIKIIDEDGDGILSDSEKLKFEKFAQGEDEELSIEKLQEIYKSIKDSTFNIEEYSMFIVDTAEVEPTEETEQETESTQQTTSTGGGGGGNYTPAPSSKKEEKKTLDKMNKTELEAEKTTAQSTLNEKQTQLANVLNGTDDSISKLQGDVDTAYEAFQKALTEVAPELAKELDDVVGRIKEQESAIDAKEMEVAQQESKVSIAETDLANAKSTRDAAKASLDALNSVSVTDLNAEQLSALSSQKAAAQAALDSAEAAVKTAEENLKTQKDQLDKLKNELDNLKGEQGLGALQKEKETIDEKISTQKPELADLQKAYNDAKSTYDQWKPQFVAAAKEEFLDAQKYINEINGALNNVENKDMQKQLKFSKAGEFFDNDVEISSQYINENGMQYLVIGPKNADPNVEYPMMVYLHGDPSQMYGEQSFYYNSFVRTILTGKTNTNSEYNLSNFNGYIICPLETRTWCSSAAVNKIDNIINSFTSTHNVDTDNISLVGHSAGGVGALYQAQKHLNNSGNTSGVHFSRVATISPMTNGNADISAISNEMGLRGYTAKSDNCYVKAKGYGFIETVGEDNVFIVEGAHGDSPGHSLMVDADGDGISDLLYWLVYGDDD